jgi:hypothetical protein
VIVLWGVTGDGPLDDVHAALLRRGCRVRLLDQRRLTEATAELSDGARVTACLHTGEATVDLSDCTAVYVRPYASTELPAIRRAGRESPEWARAQRLDDVLAEWTELTDALVVNRPSAMSFNASKPLQARELERHGFLVPDTLITTDPDAVAEFRDRHSRVIYKSISSVRSIVGELTDAKMAEVEAVCWCPTQFQEYVGGTDVRVHVVGEEVFAAEIESEAVDYRYAAWQGLSAALRPISLPDDVADRCIAASRAMGLVFSGVDLKRTPDGRWYCFEINPSPGFTYYQHATGQAIDEAAARLLSSWES